MVRRGPRFQDTDEFRGAARDFMVGFWETEQNKRLMSMTMSSMWERYRVSGRYEQLRQRLSDAARGARGAWED